MKPKLSYIRATVNVYRCCFLSLCAILMAGCSTTHVRWDAGQLRLAAIDYYSDQVIDNLIRARNGQMFVHVNLTGLNAEVGTKVAGSVGGGETDVDTITRGPAGALITAANATTKPFFWSVSPEHNNKLQINAQPEVNDAGVYQLYIQFLNLPENAGNIGLSSLSGSGLDVANAGKIHSVVSVDGKAPKHDDYVPGTLKKWRGKQYYVPMQYKQAYFDLCVSLVSRIKVKPPGAASVEKSTNPVETLMPKYDSPELRLLQQLQQRIELK